jgi:hypothetical protein
LHADPDALYEFTIGVASGHRSKAEIAEFFRTFGHAAD